MKNITMEINFHEVAKNFYNDIKENKSISDDIKQSWLETCIVFCDVTDLCNY